MTEKRVKAWAVVDKRGDLLRAIDHSGGYPYAIYDAGRGLTYDEAEGERVVTVTIVWEEK